MRASSFAFRVAMATLVAFAPLGMSATASAQTQPEPTFETGVLPLNELQAPPSPVLTLLGAGPTSVDRPTGVKAIVVSALSSLTTGDGFPKNYAVEVAPYWMASHDAKNFDDYYASGPVETMLQHFSVSAATAPIPGLGDNGDLGTSVGVGVRTLLAVGIRHPFLSRTLNSLDGAHKAYLDATEVTPLLRVLRAARGGSLQSLARLDQIESFTTVAEELESHEEDVRDLRERLREAPEDKRSALEKELGATLAKLPDLEARALALIKSASRNDSGDAPLADAAALMVIDNLLATLEETRSARATAAAARIQALAREVQAFDLQRIGFMAAVSSAVAWDIPGDVTEQTRLGRAALWVTPSYRWLACPATNPSCESALDVTGVFRFTRDNRAITARSYWDTGVRVTWQPRPKVGASAEWVRAFREDADDADRVVGIFEYRLAESAFLYASFGRDFQEADVRRNLVSIVGLTFGFGQQPIVRAFTPRAGT